MTYFSIQQLDYIPITFYGLQNLLYSNGYNLQNHYTPKNDLITANSMGINTDNAVISTNYNISFFILFLIPFLTGLIGFSILKFFYKM
jgi:hypothetical protein